MGIFDKAKDALIEHKDKVEQGITKAADMVDQRTGNKYAEHVDQAENLAKDRLGSYAGEPNPAADPAPAGEPAPAADPTPPAAPDTTRPA